MENKVDFMKKGDFAGLCKLLNHCFTNMVRFSKNISHTCNDFPENYDTHLVIRDKGRVVSHVGVFPMMMKIYGGGILRIGGIGGVATYKEYRGHGFMNILLEKAIEEMKKKYDISWLGGDRRRYGNFGWENGGRKIVFSLTDRSVKKVEVKKFSIRKCSKEKKYLEAVEKMHAKEWLGLDRSHQQSKLIYRHENKDIFLAFKGSRLTAYMIVKINQDKNNKKVHTAYVNEYGGDLDGIKALAKYVVEALNCHQVTVTTPVYNNKYKELFAGMTSLASVSAYGEMMKIISLKGVLKSYEKHMSLKLKNSKLKAKACITLIIKNTGEAVTLNIGKGVKVTDKLSSRKIILSDRDMVRLLFGLTKPSDDFKLGAGFAALDLIFPLDFYFWPNETV